MKQRMPLGLALATATVFGISACGGGSDSGSGSATPAATTFSGTAATGAAMAGATVSISCAVGSGTATTASNGTYTKDLTGVTLPCVLKVASADGATVLYSVTTPAVNSSTAQVANLTPLTQLLVASLAGTDPAVFFANASASNGTSTVTAGSVSAAQAAVMTMLGNAGMNLTGVTDLLTGSLVAATSSTPGNGYDMALDALKVKLVASGTTMATLTTAVAAASPAASPVTAATNTPSLPPAQMLKVADNNCSALRSGDYWAITPTQGGTLANQFFGGSYDASTKTAANLMGDSTVLHDSGACQYVATDDVSRVVVSQAGVAVTRYADSDGVFRMGLAIPKQTVAVSELAGNWSTLNFVTNDAGTNYESSTTTLSISATGMVSNFMDCRGAVSTSSCSPVTNAISFRANSDGALDIVDATVNNTGRVFAYRAGSGSLVMVVVDSDGTLSFFTRQRTLTLPAVGTVNPMSWSVRNSNSLVAGAFATNYTSTVTSQDVVASSFTRNQNTASGTPDYSETILINNPRNGYNFRAAATGVHSTTSPTGTTSIRERTGLSLPGIGISLQSIPSVSSFQLTIDQQP